MAFTDAQEEVLEQIIEAYENGKRLSDLPEVSGTNPYDLYVEVLENGESKKAALAAMLPYVEEQCSYGIKFDTTVSSPTCTRVGSSDLHKSLPIQSRMKGCLLDDDGNVVEYLNPTDWTGNTRDGSRGQVMVELPMHYRKCSTSGTTMEVRISELPLPGYTLIPKMYVSAYEATLERSTLKLSSVVNTSTDFRGGNNNADYDGTYRSFLGVPVTQVNRTNFRTYARNRNSAATTEWNMSLYRVRKVLYWFFAIEYATLNSQADFNAELDSNGYHQGGLGAGVTTWDWSSWSSFNGNYPFIPCGTTDSLGNASGVVAYTLYSDDAGTELKTFNVPRYRGVENFFGHIWDWTDEINVRISPTTDNGGDGLSKVFVCDDLSKLSDTGYDGYKHVGNEARTEAYVKQIIFGDDGEIMPAVVGGSNTTYFCDYHYTNIPTKETLRGVLFGGSASSGTNAGFVYASSYNAPSGAAANFGSRLCFVPAA